MASLVTPTSYNGIVTNMSTVDAVSLKLPTIWTAGPSAWFAQVESQFALRGVTQDDTKYHHVVASLDNSTAQRTLSILVSPPATEKYQLIKLFLTSAYELPDYERAAALFNMSGLGDYKPSQRMDNMLTLLGEHRPCFSSNICFYNNCPITSEPHWPHQRLQITDSTHKKPIKSMLLGIPSNSMYKKSTLLMVQQYHPHM